jgi:hypothetical protein
MASLVYLGRSTKALEKDRVRYNFKIFLIPKKNISRIKIVADLGNGARLFQSSRALFLASFIGFSIS